MYMICLQSEPMSSKQNMAFHKLFQPVSLFLALIIIIALNSIHQVHGAPTNARVQSLPGYSGNLSSEIYTGYVTVDESHGRALFYYFVKSERNPDEDPLLLWLTGGPGCSSFNGFIYEIGPLYFDLTQANESLPKMKPNPDSWSKLSNIIFLDSPVGTGYSYSNTSEDYKTGDIKTVSDVHTFLIKWFEEYPEFLSNPIYIGGDSYGGIVVPLVAQEIVNGNEAGVRPTLNLKGYMVGNGLTDTEMDFNGKVPFAHGMALISDELYQALKGTCNGSYYNPTTDACNFKMQAFWQDLIWLYPNNILDPLCFFSMKKQRRVSSDENVWKSWKQTPLSEKPLLAWRMFGHWFTMSKSLDEYLPSMLKIGEQHSPCGVDSYRLSNIWANNPIVRKAIHAQTEDITGEWQRCSWHLKYNSEFQSVVKYHMNLTMHGYHALIYNGDHDMVIPFPGTQTWIRSLGYPIVDDWRSWFVDGQVAGYSRTYDKNLTFTTIKGAGHTAPEYKPRQSYVMFERWTSGQPL